MPAAESVLRQLAEIPNLQVQAGVPLAAYTRFGIGGPADILAETARPQSFLAAAAVIRSSGLDAVVIGGGTNLVVSDEGFRGVVLRFTASAIQGSGNVVIADAGAELEDLVRFTVDRGLQGLETLMRIPGSVGAAVYGNAGAYGHSISERVREVRFYDGAGVRIFDAERCEFRYRESVFKRHKDWVIFSVEFLLEPGNRDELRRTSARIQAVRDEKFPPAMKCAGSIFKNLLLAELPESIAVLVPAEVIHEGKVPAGWFLEQAGAKGMARGDIQVANHHANLIYNRGAGKARDLRALIEELKQRVRDRFGLELEEEVQYVGLPRELTTEG
jgi:UDP-N-acetylmuramate dehydrogenase